MPAGLWGVLRVPAGSGAEQFRSCRHVAEECAVSRQSNTVMALDFQFFGALADNSYDLIAKA